MTRVDLFSTIHKALRAELFHALVAVDNRQIPDCGQRFDVEERSAHSASDR